MLLEEKLLEAKLIDNRYNGWKDIKYPFQLMYEEPGQKCLYEPQYDLIRKRMFCRDSCNEKHLRNEFEAMFRQ